MAIHRFFITQDTYTGSLFFCNLCGCFDEGIFSVGSDGYLHPGVVAHDVLEHSLAHRVRNYVPWEEELHAIGKAAFVRQAEIEHDYVSMLESITRPLRPIPNIVADNVAVNVLNLEHPKEYVCGDEQIGLSVRDHINYGYLYNLWRSDSKRIMVPNAHHFYDLADQLEDVRIHEYAIRTYFAYDLCSMKLVNTRTVYL